METSLEAVKALLKEIIPHFGLPGSIQSDNRPAFISEITQKVNLRNQVETLHGMETQASGKVEKMNHTLKKNVAKLC